MKSRQDIVITTEAAARRLAAARASSTRIRYDLGKYKGKAGDYVGRPLNVSGDVLAVYPKQQRDSHGPYVALYCWTADTALTREAAR